MYMSVDGRRGVERQAVADCLDEDLKEMERVHNSYARSLGRWG